MPAPALDVLYCDNHILVVRKPAGVLVQPDKSADITLVELAKAYLKQRFSKPGNVFAAPVHRLDRSVSGVVVMARTSKAASRISEQFRNGDVRKTYWAIVEGRTPISGALNDNLVRAGQHSSVAKGDDGKLAKLTYRRLRIVGENSAVEISLLSGRHHQIRVQFAAFGHPIVGDRRYGSKQPFPHRAIALHAHAVTFTHPTRQEELTFQCGVDSYWPRVF